MRERISLLLCPNDCLVHGGLQTFYNTFEGFGCRFCAIGTLAEWSVEAVEGWSR